MQKNIIDTKKLEAVLKQAHSTAESDQSGANASYIPCLLYTSDASDCPC